MSFIFDDYNYTEEPFQSSTHQQDIKLKLSKDELSFIKKVCRFLMVLGIIKNKTQFSEEFLGKSKDYMAMLETTGRIPSVNSLHHLIKALDDTNTLYIGKNHTIETNLSRLVTEGRDFITKRLLKFM